MKRITGLLLLALLAGGCTMAPRYARPEPEAPAAWPADAAPARVADPAAVLPAPGEFFVDPRLRGTLELALEHNRDLRLAGLNAEKVRAYYRIERGGLLPAVSAIGSGSKRRTPADLSSTGATSFSESYSVQAGVSAWELDLFGRLRSLKKQALEQWLATVEGERGVRLAVAAATGQAWLGLAASTEQLRLAEAAQQAMDSLQVLVRLRHEAGLATRLDLLRADSQRLGARQSVDQYRLLAARDRHALDLVVGAELPAALLPDGISEVPPPREPAVGLPSEVLLARPDILAAEHRLKAANAQIGAARAAFFPRITLTGLAGSSSAELDGLFKAGSESWTFAPSASLPLLDTRVWAASDVSRLEREIAETQYQSAIRAAFRDVADALAARQAAGRQLGTQEELVAAAIESDRLARERWMSGLDGYLGVLDAERSLRAAQQALVGLRLADQASLVQLYAALGGETLADER